MNRNMFAWVSIGFLALPFLGREAIAQDLTDTLRPVVPAAAPAFAAPVKKKLPIVALQPLSGKGVTPGEAELIGDALGADLQKTDSVRVMERSQMDKILAEQGFQQSGACNGAECAVQIGQLLGIDRMVVGTVGRLGNSYMLSVRIADVGTGEILRSTSRTLEAPIEAVVTILVPVVAQELVGIAPDLSGITAAENAAKEARKRAAALAEAAAAPKSAPAPEPQKSSHTALWVTGGVAVVAGGAAAAYFLTQGKTTEAPAAAAAPVVTDVWVNW